MSDWKTHTGTTQPEETRGKVVDVKLRDGDTDTLHADAMRWSEAGRYTIARYRLSEPQPKPQPTPEDEAWAEAEARMNVVGQNGNTGEHYDEARTKAAKLWPIVKHFADGGTVGEFDCGHFYESKNPDWSSPRIQIKPGTLTTWLWVREFEGGQVACIRANAPNNMDKWTKVPGTEREESA
jgi:hypothetical protein